MKRSPLIRRTPLRSHSELKRSGVPLPKRAAAKPLKDGEFSEAEGRRVVYGRSNGVCEKCGQHRATEWHHRRNRSLMGQWNPANGFHLCHWCHVAVTPPTEENFTEGWLVPSWDSSRLMPVRHWRLGFVYLDDAGNYLFDLIGESA